MSRRVVEEKEPRSLSNEGLVRLFTAQGFLENRNLQLLGRLSMELEARVNRLIA